MHKYMMSGLLLVAVVAAGCSAPVRSGNYTVASTKHDASVLGSEFVLVKKNATGTATTPIILFPFGFPKDYKVMKNILDENNGDILTNVKITTKITMVLFYFGATKLSITCDVWRLADHSDVGGKAQTYDVSEIGKVEYVRPSDVRATDGGSK